ncbi:uncharacterized zinc finger CCHC domain-containing protein At4g19190 isoform X2 [Ricinus communis]|uniref:Cir, putative n=1 Tax=Ricinus communis TaxID=3988 RepID=B9S1S8_RICCO|nr:uncharacterized zinc finger CCHC domain-containing protein At4g19190 isoform X2 [Ricinus communis]EEF42547.1 cir, putative [Ricinus communis]|eukprot:XP_002519943.1 uncharacterized zinc finger CCHC domain-containing protein At4g19190 isoform X2 [Ricinus communis]
MEGEEGGGIRLSKRINNGEVDYKTKSGTAWSHSYLNQKPWHPLSYPNQRRKWIAEQTHAQRQKRTEEVSREYAQEQEFFRQTALISKKEKEKIETMKAVSFMYVRPPGYNAESAKAAEIADERKRQEEDDPSSQPALLPESTSSRDPLGEEKKKLRPKDVFGRPVPTEEEFQVLKNAPRLETGLPARVKPFGIEVRNVKCIRCGTYGHQSGDRECPLKDAIMPNEESRLKRDDPLTAIMAQMDPSEPLKWELKQKPGMSPPRGGFDPDDPNQQIVAEDIFDEYGGFLGGDIPELLTNFSPTKSRKKIKKHKRKKNPSPSKGFTTSEEDGLSSPSDNEESRSKKLKTKKKLNHPESSSFDDLKFGGHSRKSRRKHSYSPDESGCNRYHRSKRSKQKHSYSSDDSGCDRHHKSKRSKQKPSYSSEDSGYDRHHRSKNSRRKHSYSSEESDFEERRRSENRKKHLASFEHSSPDRHHKNEKKQKKSYKHSSDDSDFGRRCGSKHSRHCH